MKAFLIELNQIADVMWELKEGQNFIALLELHTRHFLWNDFILGKNKQHFYKEIDILLTFLYLKCVPV